MDYAEFMQVLAKTEVTEKYPFGSCQYRTVAQGYNAAKAVGVENLRSIFDEDAFIETMFLKGRRDELDFQMKTLLLWDKAKVDSNEHAVEVSEYIEALANGESEIDLSVFWIDSQEDGENEIKEILELKDVQEMLKYAENQAYDLWSVSLPVAYPILDNENTPDVGTGPIFNMMAWEQGYAQGIAMALFEYVYEQEMDWGKWDT